MFSFLCSHEWDQFDGLSDSPKHKCIKCGKIEHCDGVGRMRSEISSFRNRDGKTEVVKKFYYCSHCGGYTLCR